ncbi:MAG: hypothetical protein MJZ30_09990 [Paludibacteraceae bacterium]|nr:hypothetical protein [Paludibacteraceae bacterium]
MALGKDTKIIKQGVDKIIDILEGGGSGEIAEVKKVIFCEIGDNVLEDTEPIIQEGVKVFVGNGRYQFNRNGLEVILLTEDDYVHENLDNVAGIVEVRAGEFSSKILKNIGITITSFEGGMMKIHCLKRLEEGNPDSVNFVVEIECASRVE